MSIEVQWVRAFARQADADFRAWELYEMYPEAVSAECHRMQFLQMACEKLCKACVLSAKMVTLDRVQTSHGFVKKQLSTILKQELSYKNENGAQLKTVMQDFKRFAQEVEVLNPSMDRDNRPDNCEYPWEYNGQVLSPLDRSFYLSDLMLKRSGTNFLKSLRSAINRILADSAP
jgi:hypothetical protein